MKVTNPTKKIVFLLLLLNMKAYSQSNSSRFVKNGNFYFAWGYNKEWYGKTNIHIDQDLPGNVTTDYTLMKVQAHDHIGWDHLFMVQMSIPQYNYRVGYFFNRAQDLGIELNFDHTKYVVTDYQSVRMRGNTNGEPFDSTAHLTPSNFHYQLNNGANFFLFNIVKKFDLHDSPKGRFHLCYLLKAGIGPVIPHVQNTIFGHDNNPHFQFGGWNVGAEAALRAVLFKYVYLDFAQKGDFARYAKLRIYGGTAAHYLKTYEMIFTLGVNIPHLSKKAETDSNIQ